MLDRLQDISSGKDALQIRGGTYDPALNIWVADGFATEVEQSSPETRQFLEAMADLSMAAGQLHLQQLRDAKGGRMWPSAWLRESAGEQVISFCQAHPDAASPYACIDFQNNRAIPDTSPSPKARTEFRRALINAGHGANPPKSAKNYPNQDWIRADYGYRNVVFANQAQEKVRSEMIPALKAAFDTSWSRDPLLVDRMLRASALFIVAHEECHPWVVCNEASWLEELKCNALGMLALHRCEAIRDKLSEVVLTTVAGALSAHRRQAKLMARGEMQLQDYYIGDVIFTTFLADNGYFVYDSRGRAKDVNDGLAAPLVTQFVQKILAIKRGESSAGNLYKQFYRDASVFERFRILAE